MADRRNVEKTKSKGVKRKTNELEDRAGNPKIAKTEQKPKPKHAEKKPTTFNPKKIIAKYYRIKVQETVAELINPTTDDFDALTTFRRLEYYFFMAKVKARKVGIPCCLEFKINIR